MSSILSSRTHRYRSPHPRGRWFAVLVAIWLSTVTALVHGVESDPLPVPKGSGREHAVGLYNDGVQLLLRKNYGAAQWKFESALALDEPFAEAHNNLAFSLRAQGPQHHERALRHYDRAIALKPQLAVAYAYRGMLFVARGEIDRARADHARLLKLDAKLAERLARAIAGELTDTGFDGVAAQYE